MDIIQSIGFGVQPHPIHGTGALAIHVKDQEIFEGRDTGWLVKLPSKAVTMTPVEAEKIALNLIRAASECRRRDEEADRLLRTVGKD